MDPRLLDWCKRLIATPSVTNRGTRRIAELCAHELLVPSGIDARLISSSREGPEQVNLLGVVQGRDADATPLVLNTHLDTVPPGDPASWTACDGDPFAASRDGDRIYGLGAADAKLDFLAKAEALIECRWPRRTTYLVATFGEERGLVGAQEMVELALLPRGALAFVGEPSGLKLITAHKGLMAFELLLKFEPVCLENPAAASTAVFTGRAAHSSTPALGVNAIRMALREVAKHPEPKIVALDGGDAVNRVAARCEVTVVEEAGACLAKASKLMAAGQADTLIPAPAIDAISRFVDELYQFAGRRSIAEEDFAAPTLTCNAGLIRTEESCLRLEFELRPPPSLALAEVRDGVEQLAAGLAAPSQAVEVSLRERRANSGFRCALDSETFTLGMAAMANARLPLEVAVKSGCTEAGVYAAAGLHPVVIGPGPSVGVIHAPNEYNYLSEIEAAVRFYRALLEQ